MRNTPGVAHSVAISGQSFVLGAYGSNFGQFFIILDEFHDRSEPEHYRAHIERNLGRPLKEGELDAKYLYSERIAARLSVAGLTSPVDAGDDEGPAQPVVSPEAAAILQDLVKFYDRFAATNVNDPRLKRDTARALRQVAVIRLRLGQHALAEQALRQAVALLTGSADPLERARLRPLRLLFRVRADGREATHSQLPGLASGRRNHRGAHRGLEPGVYQSAEGGSALAPLVSRTRKRRIY